MPAADFNEEQLHNQDVYIRNVISRQNTCVATVAALFVRRVPNRGWNVSDTALAGAGITDPLDNEPPNRQGENNNETPVYHDGPGAGGELGQQSLGDFKRSAREPPENNGSNHRQHYAKSSDEDDLILNPLDFYNQAKRQKLDLEF